MTQSNAEGKRRFKGALRLTSGSKEASDLISIVAVPSSVFTIRVAQSPVDLTIRGRITINCNQWDESVEDVIHRFSELLASLPSIPDLDVDMWVTGEFPGMQVPFTLPHSAMAILARANADLLFSLYAGSEE